MSFKISEICAINPENISKRDNFDYINYLDTANITEGVIDEVQYLIIGENKIPSRAKRKVQPYDIVVSTVRPNQKHYGILRNVANNMIASTGFAVLRPNKTIVYPEYLYRFLTQESITKYLQTIAENSVSAYPSIKPSVIGELEIYLPSMDEQIRASNILETLDYKIEINNRINNNLEEMAQGIFKQWFVDFEFPNKDGQPNKSSGGKMVESELGMIPDGWFVKRMDAVVEATDYVANGSFKSLKENVKTSEDVDHAILVRLVDYNNGFRGPFKYVDENGYDFLKKSKLFGGEIVISNVGANVGTVFRVPQFKIPMTLGPNSIVLKDNEYTHYLYNYFTSRIGQTALSSIVTGSAQPKFNKTNFRALKVIVPESNIIEQFNKIITNLFKKQSTVFNESITLEKLRDSLLPKLMSGEIRIES